MSEGEFIMEPQTPQLIAAVEENVMPNVNQDLILAKNFLKQQTAATGDSLYDHLVDLVQKILTHKPPDVVDNFEQYSWEVKQEKYRPNFDLLNDMFLAPPQLAMVRRVEEMFRLAQSRTPKDVDAEEQELELEEILNKAKVQDIIDHNYYFREAGYGLPDQECYMLYMAMHMLGYREPVASVRFFGKIFGRNANYYVAETDLTEDELERRIREFEMKDMPPEEAEPEIATEEQRIHELLGEGEFRPEIPTGPVPPPLPPVPQSTWKPPKPIPVERPGQGVNKKYYWVCHSLGEPWTCLPDVTPQQITVARQTVHVMTGDLDAELQLFPTFEGRERHYLRAQIARIQAATSISPRGFYTFGSGEEEEDIDMEEGMGDVAFNVNPFYQGHTLTDLLDANLTYWVHHGRHILKQGRTIWFNPNVGGEEDVEEEEDDELPKILPETGPHMFSTVGDDNRIEGIPAWTPRNYTMLSPDRAVAVLRSNYWPGAIAYANNHKKSECLYIGWALKYQPPNFSPVQLPRPQHEYPLGPEVMEMADPTFADEEAYRIAHLPPVPPPMVGEGEGEGLEEEEEEDDEEEEEEEE